MNRLPQPNAASAAQQTATQECSNSRCESCSSLAEGLVEADASGGNTVPQQPSINVAARPVVTAFGWPGMLGVEHPGARAACRPPWRPQCSHLHTA
eukprot:55149-Chlamydomonas_euryale.AAC.11